MPRCTRKFTLRSWIYSNHRIRWTCARWSINCVKLAKIELVGGAYYIAELTSKVSSAANIEYHARVIMEMAIKRELIQVASANTSQCL